VTGKIMPLHSMSSINSSRIAHQCLLLAATLPFSFSCFAGTLNINATDKNGANMADVVIYASPVGGNAPAASPVATTSSEPVAIGQNNLQFSPYVTAIQVGSSVRFPNYDKIEHHVKSFSPTKEFEIKTYDKGTPPPVQFDKPGVVVVYCVLHEWMRAYVMVVDTPWFDRTDATGNARLEGLKPGTWEIKAWHPDYGSIKPPLKQTVQVTDTGMTPLSFNFDLVPKKRRPAKPM
jgi:plastocyanin